MSNEPVKCCVCDKENLSTVEGDGGSECQLSDGRWVCSEECWEKANPLTHTSEEMRAYGERVRAEIADLFDANGNTSSRWAHEVVTGAVLPELP